MKRHSLIHIPPGSLGRDAANLAFDFGWTGKKRETGHYAKAMSRPLRHIVCQQSYLSIGLSAVTTYRFLCGTNWSNSRCPTNTALALAHRCRRDHHYSLSLHSRYRRNSHCRYHPRSSFHWVAVCHNRSDSYTDSHQNGNRHPHRPALAGDRSRFRN